MAYTTQAIVALWRKFVTMWENAAKLGRKGKVFTIQVLIERKVKLISIQTQPSSGTAPKRWLKFIFTCNILPPSLRSFLADIHSFEIFSIYVPYGQILFLVSQYLLIQGALNGDPISFNLTSRDPGGGDGNKIWKISRWKMTLCRVGSGLDKNCNKRWRNVLLSL